jgi:hypothetical protein
MVALFIVLVLDTLARKIEGMTDRMAVHSKQGIFLRCFILLCLPLGEHLNEFKLDLSSNSNKIFTFHLIPNEIELKINNGADLYQSFQIYIQICGILDSKQHSLADKTNVNSFKRLLFFDISNKNYL